MAKRNTRNRRHKRKNMRGGAFSQEEQQILSNRGLADDQIEMLNNMNISFNEVMRKINEVTDNFDGNTDGMSQLVMDDLLNQHISQGQNDSQETVLDKFDEDDINVSSNFSTQKEKGGSKKRRRTTRKSSRKNRRTRKSRQRGGNCFGSGVGANSYDPNYSIYNTNMLKLFPYRSN